MNMNNKVQIKASVLSNILDRSITEMIKKHYNILSSRIIPIQIKHV
jgi:hypothetical protein